VKVPFVDLRAQHEESRAPVEAAMRRVLDSQQFILGPEVETFERCLSALAGCAHAVGCASGTDALVLALQACGVGRGDEVAVPAFSFFATASSAALAGARPVFVDIEPASFNLDPARLDEGASTALKAVIAVHLFGRPAAADRIAAWCDERSVALIEDAAQALGARLGGRRAGSLGRAAAFSFFPTKNLGAFGDAGALTTSDADLAARARVLRDHGRAGGEYEHRLLGANSRLDALQAAVLAARADFLEDWTRRRIDNARRYETLFASRGLGRAGSGLVTPGVSEGAVFHQYVVRVERDRDGVRRFLTERGIGCAVYYPLPLHRQPALAERGRQAGALAESERACREVLALPIHPHLTVDQQEAVVESLAAAVGV
jgi:dTDP-4-amino-4,6-dideoxygalactose transaminase